jgi:DNA-directed RNA polymerase alpha subunit
VATLEQDGRLEMRLTIRRGRGYSSANDNKGNENIVGVIPIDSIFSPVVRVAYSVEPARVGQRTDFDKLTLEVETNGAVDPRDAVAKAAAILRDELALFIDDDVTPAGTGKTEDTPEPPDPILEKSIDVLGLGVRSSNSLKRAGIEIVGELVSKTEAELMELPNFGRKSIEDVRDALKKHKLYLEGDADKPQDLPEVEGVGPEEHDPILEMRIDELDLGVRSLNCLKREGIETVGDLISKTEKELMCIPNFGRKSIEDVRERLATNNLKLRGE